MTEEEQLGLTTDWMRKQDDAREQSLAFREMMAGRMRNLEDNLYALSSEVKVTNDWLKTNHDTLNDVAVTVRSLQALSALAEKLAKWIKPIAWIAGTLGAIWIWGKSTFSLLWAHVR